MQMRWALVVGTLSAIGCGRGHDEEATPVVAAVPWSEHGRWQLETQDQVAELEDRVDRLALRAVLAPIESRRALETSLAQLYAACAQVDVAVRGAGSATRETWPRLQAQADGAAATLRQTLERGSAGLARQMPEETWRLLQRLPYERRQDYKQGTEAWLQSLERRVERLRHQPDGTGDRRAEVGVAVARLDGAKAAVRAQLLTFAAVPEDDWDMWKAGLRVQVDHLRDEVAERTRQLVAGGMR
jgi:hypothetical protein